MGGIRKLRSEHSPWGLLGMIVLVWIIELQIANRRFDFLNTTNVTWAISRRSVRSEAVTSEVLVFGDSLLKYGVVPAVIEQRTGKPAYNLATSAGSAPASFFLLRQALDAGARPSAVLVDFEPNILARTPLVVPEWWAELLSLRDGVELARSGGDAGFLARVVVAWFLPSERYRYELRAAIMQDLQNEHRSSRDDVPSLRRNADRNQGALVMPHRRRGPVAVALNNPALFPPTWQCNPLNRRYVRELLALAASHQIPVFWVVTPYTPAIQTAREQLGQDALFTRFVTAMRSQFPGITVLDGRKSAYDPSVFWDDMVHLDGRGALTLSVDVAAAMRRTFNGGDAGEWVRLPAYRERDSDAPLEDVEQSRMALHTAPGKPL